MSSRNETGTARTQGRRPRAERASSNRAGSDITLSERRPYRVRIGPLSVFVLVAILALSVMGVLVFTTANASFVLARRQAAFVESAYGNERVAQAFVATIDDALVPVREGTTDGGSAVARVEGALDAACVAARKAGGSQVSVQARMGAGGVVDAVFSHGDGRSLSVKMRIDEGGTYEIEEWQATKVQNEEQEDGQLYVVGS